MTASNLKVVRGGESALAMAKRRYNTVDPSLLLTISATHFRHLFGPFTNIPTGFFTKITLDVPWRLLDFLGVTCSKETTKLNNIYNLSNKKSSLRPRIQRFLQH